MNVSYSLIEEYPNKGTFYYITIDKSKPRDEWKEEKVIILETPCDIQENSVSSSSAFTSATWAVFFEYDITAGISIKRGNKFEGDVFGVRVNGEVLGVVPTQLGCVCYVKDLDV